MAARSEAKVVTDSRAHGVKLYVDAQGLIFIGPSYLADLSRDFFPAGASDNAPLWPSHNLNGRQLACFMYLVGAKLWNTLPNFPRACSLVS